MAAQAPYCPPGWRCDFTPPPAPELPWWQGTGGAVMLVIAILVVAILLVCLGVAIFEQIEARRSAKHIERERAKERAHELAVEEQRTMQLDAAQGNPEVLKLVRAIGKK